ncbi:hypothetical protein D3C80_1510940 [compost metagenome]
MYLGFGGTGTNGAPAHQIGKVLRSDHIQELTRRRQASIVDFQKQFARNTQSVVDLETVVHVRIVDQPFPAHRGARLFEIDTHDHFQLTFQLFAKREQTRGILFRRCGIVNGTGTDDDQQTIVIAVKDFVDRFTGMRNGVRSVFSGGEFFKERYRR